jgi:hypothetical protein
MSPKEGELGKNAKNHLAEYVKEQRRLRQKLDTDWQGNNCENKGHTLPSNTRQYAEQQPQLGPGKPLGPAPTPIYTGPKTPVVSVPQAPKPSK